MNKLLVTGLALGKEIGVCSTCNFDFDWILKYPSILIWADSILITPVIWETVSKGDAISGYKELSKCLKLIFDMSKDEKIISIMDPKNVIHPTFKKYITEQVDKDRIMLARKFPQHITIRDSKGIPGQVLFVDNNEYCLPNMYSIYAGLVLAKVWGANCLFNDRIINFCKFRFGLSQTQKRTNSTAIKTFQTIFQAHIPNTPILPEYAVIDKKKCLRCANEKKCSDKYLLDVEKNIKNIIKWRDYDEVQQLKNIINDIIRKRDEANKSIDSVEVLGDFYSKEKELKRRLKLIFPNVKRWANITTLLSIPIIVAGVATGQPLITVSGAGLAGLSEGAKELVDLFSSKYSWVSFINKDIELT